MGQYAPPPELCEHGAQPPCLKCISARLMKDNVSLLWTIRAKDDALRQCAEFFNAETPLWQMSRDIDRAQVDSRMVVLEHLVEDAISLTPAALRERTEAERRVIEAAMEFASGYTFQQHDPSAATRLKRAVAALLACSRLEGTTERADETGKEQS